MQNLIIRKGTKEDVPAVHKLVVELATYEKAPGQVTNTVEKMMEDGFGPAPVYGLIVAEDLTPGLSPKERGEIIGIAIYFIKYSTWRGKGLFLEDLIVTEAHRKTGIGKKLFDAVVSEAKKMDAKTMHWQVLDWNTPAINFYKKYKCTFEPEWLDCKLTEVQIKQL